jgi:hypothetical protein
MNIICNAHLNYSLNSTQTIVMRLFDIITVHKMENEEIHNILTSTNK